MTVNRTASNADPIDGEAWERYLLDLLRSRVDLANRDGSPYRPIDEVRFVGDSYPHWGFEIGYTNSQNGQKVTSRFRIEDWKSRVAAEEAITNIMIAVEEGG